MPRSVIPRAGLEFHSNPLVNRGIHAFFQALESRFGIQISRTVIEASELDTADLRPLSPLITSLRRSGIISDIFRTRRRNADEPHLCAWSIPFSTAPNDVAGGSSATSEYNALIAALAEALERHIWRFESDYMETLQKATEEEMVRYDALPLARYAGFSPDQRTTHWELRMTPETSFLWTRAHSLVSGRDRPIPAQIISGRHLDEPLVRPIITTGLATHETKEKALLAGALEVIERDAYMITWLNKLSPPRIDLEELAKRETDVAYLLEQLRKYRLTAVATRLISDAPAHVVLVVVRDSLESGVPCVIGLGSSTRIGNAVAHAIAEALRIRSNFRNYWLPRIDPKTITKETIRHEEHGLYWLAHERHHQLSFLTDGPLETSHESRWENDNPEEHLERIVSWCKEKGYEFLAVNLGKSKKNTTPLHVYNVVIPELQPMHLVEKFPAAHGERLSDVPRLLGYTPREKLFTEEPHPFV